MYPTSLSSIPFQHGQKRTKIWIIFNTSRFLFSFPQRWKVIWVIWHFLRKKKMNTCSSKLPIREESQKNSSKHFVTFTPTWVNDPIWRAYFSNGLVQPPTRKSLHSVEKGEGDPLPPFDNSGSLRLKKKSGHNSFGSQSSKGKVWMRQSFGG